MRGSACVPACVRACNRIGRAKMKIPVDCNMSSYCQSFSEGLKKSRVSLKSRSLGGEGLIRAEAVAGAGV